MLVLKTSSSDNINPSARQVLLFQEAMLRWYKIAGRSFAWRRRRASNYQKVIAEVLLQRTRAETVAAFFPKFLQKYPSWRKLSTARLSSLQRVLRPIGLWRRRAISIKALAREMTKRSGRFSKDRNDIESLPGVGQYIANAILLLCHGIPQPLLDVNMARVLERVFGQRKLSDIRYDPYLQRLSATIVQCEFPAELNWAILDLAATVCLPRTPRCTTCPLAEMCRWHKLAQRR